jgi:hypothetical protein
MGTHVAGRVVAQDGEHLELWGDTSLRECTLVVTGMVAEDVDLDLSLDSVMLELQLDRPAVLELQQLLQDWLQRGQL